MGAGQQKLMGPVTSLNLRVTCKPDPLCGEGRQALCLSLHAPSSDILKRQHAECNVAENIAAVFRSSFPKGRLVGFQNQVLRVKVKMNFII